MALSAPKVVTLASMLGRQSDQLLLSNAIEAVRKAAIVCEHVRRNDLVQVLFLLRGFCTVTGNTIML